MFKKIRKIFNFYRTLPQIMKDITARLELLASSSSKMGHSIEGVNTSLKKLEAAVAGLHTPLGQLDAAVAGVNTSLADLSAAVTGGIASQLDLLSFTSSEMWHSLDDVNASLALLSAEPVPRASAAEILDSHEYDVACSLKSGIGSASSVMPDIDTLTKLEICYDRKPVFIMRKRAGSLSLFKDPHKISVRVQTGDGSVVKSTPSPDPEYPVDERLIAELRGVSAFAADYAMSNYPRIAADVEAFSSFFAETKNMSIFEIGGIPPVFSSLLHQKGFDDITTLDPNASVYAEFLAKKQIKYVTGDIVQGIPEAVDTQYDVVCLNEVIEHVAGNLNEVSAHVARLLRPGGYLYLTTPNQASLHGLYGLLCTGSGLASKPFDTVYNQYDRYRKMGYYGHLREYTTDEIIKYFQMFGFECLDVRYAGNCKPQNAAHRSVIMLENFFPHRKLFAKFIFRKK